MQQHKGFSLLELVIVLVILGIISAMSSKPLTQGLMMYANTQSLEMLDWQGDFALERMARTIRSLENTASVTTATATQLSFVDNTSTAMSYTLSSGNLLENTNTLTNNVSTLTFTYYDKAGAVTSTIASIRSIQITLVLLQNGNSYTYKSAVNLPNLT